jgi:N-acetyl-beta-hexosaminidase
VSTNATHHQRGNGAPFLRFPWITWLYTMLCILVSFRPESSLHWHMGGDEMFSECLDQQPGLKSWMAANNISDYNALQQYFTKRLRCGA